MIDTPQQATDEKTIARRAVDGFVNFAARIGLGSGGQQDASRYQFNFVTRNRQQLEAAYRTNWVAGMAVDTVAQDMTRAGADITSDMDPDEKRAIEDVFNDCRVWDQLEDGVRWSRLFGGSIAVMLIDGQRLSTPLNVDTIGEGQFRGLMVLDRWLVQPSMTDLVTDYGPDMGKPRFYDVIADSLALSRETIHHSRVIRLEGVALPYWQRTSENLWGQSVLERVWDRMVAYDSTTAGAAQLVYKAHLRTFKVKGLRQILATGGQMQEGLVKQMEMMKSTQSNEGMTLMDAEDDYEAHQYTFSGLSDMMLQFAQQVSGALQIPLVRLLGQSPAGLNSTGESDLRTYYDGIAAAQNSKLRSGLHVLYEVISRSALGRPLDEGFDFQFRSLWQLSDVDKATVAGQMTTALATLDGNGLLPHSRILQELRGLSKTTGYFSSITDEDISEAEMLPPVPRPGQSDDPADGDELSDDPAANNPPDDPANDDPADDLAARKTDA